MSASSARLSRDGRSMYLLLRLAAVACCTASAAVHARTGRCALVTLRCWCPCRASQSGRAAVEAQRVLYEAFEHAYGGGSGS